MIRFSKKNNFSRGWFRSVSMALFFLLLLSEASQVTAQYGGGRERGAGPEGLRGQGMRSDTDQQLDRNVELAAQGVQKIMELILREHFTALTLLGEQDIKVIRAELAKTEPYQGKFDEDQKSYYYLTEALLAYFSGNKKEAQAQAQKAYKAAPDNPDMSDAVVTLALLYEDYNTAREVLKERQAGTEVVIDFQSLLHKSVEAAEPNQPDLTSTSEPNQAGVGGAGSAQGPSGESQGVPDKTVSSKWQLNPLQELEQRTKPRPAEQRRGPGEAARVAPAGALPGPGRTEPLPRGSVQGGVRGIADRPRMPRRPFKTFLNLPVENMLVESLGKNFETVNLRSVNGSYFHFEPGQGSILCALLWKSPSAEGSGGQGNQFRGPAGSGITPAPRPMPEFSRERDMEMMRGWEMEEGRGPGMGPAGAMPPMPGRGVGLSTQGGGDLWTNAEEFRGLFRTHLIEGKMNFVGLNFDSADRQSQERVLEIITDQPWPWTTCMIAEGINKEQWRLEAASPVLMIVDTKGKVHYAGPTGGYLPQMILDGELKLARAGSAEIPTFPMLPKGMDVWKKWAGGAGSATAGSSGGNLLSRSSDPNEQLTVEPTSGSSQTTSASVPAVTQKPDDVASSGPSAQDSEQARQMLRTAQVQKRLTPVSALNMCDEILKRWPNSNEAQEAKLMIKSILRQKPQLKESREQQGKYTGEEQEGQ